MEQTQLTFLDFLLIPTDQQCIYRRPSWKYPTTSFHNVLFPTQEKLQTGPCVPNQIAKQEQQAQVVSKDAEDHISLATSRSIRHFWQTLSALSKNMSAQ